MRMRRSKAFVLTHPSFSRRNLFHGDTASGENNQGSRAASKAGKVGAAGGDGRRTYVKEDVHAASKQLCSLSSVTPSSRAQAQAQEMKFSSEVRSRNN